MAKWLSRYIVCAVLWNCVCRHFYPIEAKSGLAGWKWWGEPGYPAKIPPNPKSLPTSSHALRMIRTRAEVTDRNGNPLTLPAINSPCVVIGWEYVLYLCLT